MKMELLAIKEKLLDAIALIDQAADALGEDDFHSAKLKRISKELFEIEYDL